MTIKKLVKEKDLFCGNCGCKIDFSNLQKLKKIVINAKKMGNEFYIEYYCKDCDTITKTNVKINDIG